MLKKHGERYLKISAFISHCRTFNIHVSDGELEYYERKGLLYPAVRIIMPLDYKKHMFDIVHNQKNVYYQKKIYEYPDEWKEIHDFERQLNFPNAISKRSGVHFLDRVNFSPHVFHPIDGCYTPWDSYRQIVGQVNGSDVRESLAVNLYHYWQVYQVYEIQNYLDSSFKRAVLARVQQSRYRKPIAVTIYAKTLKAVRRWFRMQETLEELIGDKIQFIRIPLKPEPKARGDYMGVNDLFEPLSIFGYFYKIKYTQALLTGTRKPEDGVREIKDSAYNALKHGLTHFSKVMIKKYSLNLNSLIEDLKKMCSRHDCLIKDEERHRLAELLKADIVELIRFIEFGFDIDFKAISNYVGRINGHFDNYLDVIFESAIEKAYKRGMPSVEGFWGDYANDVPICSFDKNYFDQFIDFLKNEKLDDLLFVLAEINEIWWQRDSASANKLLFSLKSMSAIPEQIIHKIHEKAPGLAFPSRATLKSCFDVLFANESWFGSLKSNWGLVNYNSIPQGIQNLNDLIDNRHILDADPQRDRVLRAILVQALVRNVTHHHKVDFHKIENLYLSAVKNITYAVFIVWFVAKISRRIL